MLLATLLLPPTLLAAIEPEPPAHKERMRILFDESFDDGPGEGWVVERPLPKGPGGAIVDDRDEYLLWHEPSWGSATPYAELFSAGPGERVNLAWDLPAPEGPARCELVLLWAVNAQQGEEFVYAKAIVLEGERIMQLHTRYASSSSDTRAFHSGASPGSVRRLSWRDGWQQVRIPFLVGRDVQTLRMSIGLSGLERPNWVLIDAITLRCAPQ